MLQGCQLYIKDVAGSVSSISKVSCHQIRDLDFDPCLHQKLISVLV